MTDEPALALPPGEEARALPIWARGLMVRGLLYVFLVGVSSLEAGIKALGSDVQETLFEGVGNPLGGLFVGMLATVLVQSSSVSTATIVGLVAAGVISVDDAVPMVMGANIGTTVTNTLVSLGYVRRRDEFRRAFAAATVHDFFNVLSVAVLLTLEVTIGLISESAKWLSERLLGSSGGEFKSPIKAAVKEPVGWIESLLGDVGLEGNALAVALIVVGLGFIFAALAFITRNMRALVAERFERSINQLLSRGGGVVAMALGVVVTVAVQSSSITTATLVPLCAAGILTLHNAYPVTLGANIGTTITALLAALATNSSAAVTVALAHTIFNVYGILIFYPVRITREIPIRLAEGLAGYAAERRAIVVVYIVLLFIVIPLVGVALLR